LDVDPQPFNGPSPFGVKSIALDSAYIGCMCELKYGMNANEFITLVFVTREKLLSSKSSAKPKAKRKRGNAAKDDSGLIIVEVGKAMLKFLRSHDDSSNACLSQIKDFIDNNGDWSEVYIEHAGNISACGNDCFIIHTVVLLPNIKRQNKDDSSKMVIGRMNVVLSARSGNITWVGDSTSPSNYKSKYYSNAYIQSRVHQSTTTFAVGVAGCPTIMLGEFTSPLTAQNIEATTSILERDTIPGFRLCYCSPRHMVVLDDCLVTFEKWGNK
jgi:hypothetical protein